MTRLRHTFGASPGQARLRSFAATAGQARLRGFAAVPRGVRTAIVTAGLVLIGGSASLLACPMCFGAEESSLIDGAKLGILAMLAITFTVQGAFAGFFFYLRRRAKRMAEIDLDAEWSELQRGSRT